MEPSSLLTEDVVWEMGAAAKTSATPPLYVGVKIGAIDETPEDAARIVNALVGIVHSAFE